MAKDTSIVPDKNLSDKLKLKDLRNDRMGLDSLMDDMIGLNIQGFKSLLAVCFRPAGYFQAAKLSDWGGKYRASFRLLFAVLALTAATRFIWASDSSQMVTEIAKLFDQTIEQQINLAKNHGQTLDTKSFNSVEASSLIFKKLMLAFPFVTVIGFALFAWAYRAWGEKLSYVVRLRYTYAVLVPSMTFSMLFNFVLILAPKGKFELLSNISIAMLFVVVAVTAYFGALPEQEPGGRIGRSICLSFISISFFFILALIMMVPLMLPILESLPRYDHSLPLIKTN